MTGRLLRVNSAAYTYSEMSTSHPDLVTKENIRRKERDIL